MRPPPADALQAFLCAHLDVEPSPAARPTIARLAEPAARYLLFGVGYLRLALRSADIVAVTTRPEPDCDYLEPVWVVPERFRDLAAGDAGHLSYVHLAGARYGIGPCRAEGDVVLPADAIAPCPPALAGAWIAGTAEAPACLVLNREALCRRLHELRAGGAAD